MVEIPFISDLRGLTGMRILRAITQGERDGTNSLSILWLEDADQEITRLH